MMNISAAQPPTIAQITGVEKKKFLAGICFYKNTIKLVVFSE